MSLIDQIAQALKTPRGAALALALVCLGLFLPGQAAIPPFDRDESRFAQATRQMLETGDFVDIRFGDVPRHLQPAGIYWVQAAFVSALGDPETREIWPHRVPSWLSAIGVTFLTWWVGALLFGPLAGRIAAGLMAGALILNVEARMAKIDATLCFATLIAQAMLAKAFMARERGETFPAWMAALFWAALGFGGLLKGPIVLLVTGGTVLGLLALERKGRWLGALRPAWGVPLMLAVAAPWYVAIGVATQGEFFRTALGYSVAGKIASTHQSHDGPFGYHLMLFPVMFWPGSLFALLAVPFAWARRKTAPVRFCLAWILPAWLVFESTGTKLPHYTLPLLPAIAALAGASAVAAGRERFFGRPILFGVAALIWVFAGALVAVGVPYARQHLEGVIPPGSMALIIGVLALQLAVLGLVAAGRPAAGAAAGVAAALLAWVNAFQLTLPGLTTAFLSPRITAAVQANAPCPTSRLAALQYHEPSLVFLNGTDTVLAKSAADAADHLAQDRACALALVGEAFAADFQKEAAARDLAPVELARLNGYNVNEGDDVTVRLYRAGP